METDELKAIIKKRSSIVEHPFGTIKRSLGWNHFLVRSKKCTHALHLATPRVTTWPAHA
jgi:hypothetical protein